jgi:pyridoxal phosphate enzyme (YggS family)
MPSDIKWHMIGHLQRKKVKYIIKHVDLIHSIDSIKLLDEINKRAMKINKVIKCLVQIKIAKESNKFGIDKNEINELINDSKKFTNIKIIGLMGMATNTNDASVINSEFSFLSNIFETIKNNDIKILSMGMSGDFSYAIKNNANMVRIGSSIFN